MVGVQSPFEVSEVFNLGWIQTNLDRALCSIKMLAGKSEEYERKGLSEWDTASVFVEPVLRGLNWDTLDIDQVNRESRRRDPLADMQLLYENKIVFLIEIKPLHDQLRGLRQLTNYGVRFFRDAHGYASRRRFERGEKRFLRGALTNGRRWVIYDLTQLFQSRPEGQPLRLSSIGELDISTADRTRLEKFLALMSRDAISDQLMKL